MYTPHVPLYTEGPSVLRPQAPYAPHLRTAGSEALSALPNERKTDERHGARAKKPRPPGRR